ncbi:MAG: hypothetical protein ACE5FI_02175 [Anaerolineales bacterium]
MTETPLPNEQTNRTMAYVSLGSAAAGWLLGGVSACAGFLFPPGFICGGIVYLLGNIAAAVTGNLGRKQAGESGDEQAGKIATAGLALGAAGTAIALLLACALGALVIAGPAIGNVYSNIVP